MTVLNMSGETAGSVLIAVISAEYAHTYLVFEQAVGIDNVMTRKEIHGEKRYELDCLC